MPAGDAGTPPPPPRVAVMGEGFRGGAQAHTRAGVRAGGTDGPAGGALGRVAAPQRGASARSCPRPGLRVGGWRLSCCYSWVLCALTPRARPRRPWPGGWPGVRPLRERAFPLHWWSVTERQTQRRLDQQSSPPAGRAPRSAAGTPPESHMSGRGRGRLLKPSPGWDRQAACALPTRF